MRASATPAGGRPVWLDLEPEPVLVFLHEGGARRTGVVFAPPFGWQEMCSYRRRRSWAQAFAAAGFPVARLDLPGTADSGGAPSDPGRLQAWTAALASTGAWLRDVTTVERVLAVGIGLGGMLACLAVADGAPLDDLVLWAVPRNGRLLVRELRAYANVVASRFGDDSKGSLDEGELELTGFRLSAETAKALAALDLTSLELPHGRGRRVLLLGHDGFPPDERLRRHLEQTATVTVERGEDYAVLMAHPQEAVVPQETIAASVAWAQEAEDAPASPSGSRRRGPPAARASVRVAHGETELVETALELEGGRFGILTVSADAPLADLTAVWLNAGALRHTGPNRTWVEIARRWAARGVPTARIDLAGIGDSDGDERVLLPNAGLYAPERITETRALLDELAARGMSDRFVLGGLCSGAYWSLHTALADSRVAAALMVNMYAFYWSEALVAERETQGSIQALGGNAWRRLWRRDVTAEQVRTAIQSIRPARLRAGAGHPVERAQRHRMERDLDRLRDRDTQALLLLSQGEPLLGQVVRQQVLGRRDRWPNLTIEQIPSRDHLFRAIALQRHVHEALDRALERALDAQIGLARAQAG